MHDHEFMHKHADAANSAGSCPIAEKFGSLMQAFAINGAVCNHHILARVFSCSSTDSVLWTLLD